MLDPVVHIDPETCFDRKQAAAALTARGFPVAEATLATKACRGGGPAFQKFGPRVIYRWGDLLDWARSRTSRPVCSTSELIAVAGGARHEVA
jgi:hypothetical protein